MKIALISNGPSWIDTFDPDERFDLRIGINRAVTQVACDWWSCADEKNLKRWDPIGLPAVFTIGAERDKMLRDPVNAAKLKRHRVLAWEELSRQRSELAGVVWNWSAPAALMLAWHLGGPDSEVHCYGVDMAGATDFGGEQCPHRNPARWAREMAEWDRLTNWLWAQKVRVIRHLPTEAK